MAGTHKHQCWDCNTVWEHSDSLFGDEEAHKCPKCCEPQFVKYYGRDGVTPVEGPCVASPTPHLGNRREKEMESFFEYLDHMAQLR